MFTFTSTRLNLLDKFNRAVFELTEWFCILLSMLYFFQFFVSWKRILLPGLPCLMFHRGCSYKEQIVYGAVSSHNNKKQYCSVRKINAVGEGQSPPPAQLAPICTVQSLHSPDKATTFTWSCVGGRLATHVLLHTLTHMYDTFWCSST